MREHYTQVANEQFSFGTILIVGDNEKDEDEQKTVYLQDEFDLDRDKSPPCHPHVKICRTIDSRITCLTNPGYLSL